MLIIKKMKFISLVLFPIFLILLSEALAQEFIDYRLLEPEETDTYSRRVSRAAIPKCTKIGLMCQDCKNILFCDSALTSSLLWTCSENQSCDDGKCIDGTTPRCSSSLTTFVCNSEGVFPDPIDCLKYHYCIQTSTGTQGAKLVDYPRSCINDTTNYYRFNARTSYCDKILEGGVCPTTGYPVPECTAPGHNDVLTENPSIYFICKMYLSTTPNSKIVLYPYQYICENGKTYIKDAYKCKIAPLVEQ